MNYQDGPSARAYVGRAARHPWGDLDVLVGFMGHHGAGVWRPVEPPDDADTAFVQPYRFEPPADDGAMVLPSFRIPEELARVLLDALAAHFGAGSDIRQALDALTVERKRVDKLIDAVIARGAQ